MSGCQRRIPQRLNLPSGPKRVQIIEQHLNAERMVYRRSVSDPYDEMIASRNIQTRVIIAKIREHAGPVLEEAERIF